MSNTSQAASMQKQHRLVMQVHPSGTLEVATGPTSTEASLFKLHVSRGDSIEFHCNDGRFGIHFPDDSPFERKEYFADAGEPIHVAIRSDAQAGSYKHNVSVKMGADHRHWDPEIVVDD